MLTSYNYWKYPFFIGEKVAPKYSSSTSGPEFQCGLFLLNLYSGEQRITLKDLLQLRNTAL